MYELILKFAPDKLFEEFANQYVYDFGELKLNKIAAIIKESKKIDDYIKQISSLSMFPTPKGLQELIFSHRNFLLAKQETFCLAALSIILSWQAYQYIRYDSEQENISTKVMAETIIYFEHLKFNHSNNTFTRYYKRLLDISESDD